ncbi:MAG: ATP-binding protein [Pseudomonadota bacterium]|nr:ATP-binding protein [Pseudomonadota bacterium]
MRFKSFEIRNFRGIEYAKLDLVPSGAGIFTLIGLNESGKTTILEAISTFHIRGGDEKSLYQTKPAETDPSSFVPKHQKATFSGDITVTAVMEFEAGEKALCVRHAEDMGKAKVEPSVIPDIFSITRGYRFKNGDYVDKINTWGISLPVKEKGARKYKNVGGDHPAWKGFSAMASIHAPDIVYFPTFLFDIPEKIILNPLSGEQPASRLYRDIIRNVGESLSPKIDIKTALVDRIVVPETLGENFLGLFALSNNRQQQIESAINQMSHQLSSTVLDSWSQIFGGSPNDREIRLKLGVDKHDDGSPRVYVQFTVRDGTQTYDIDERSTGFRWFFSFLLFTLYRARSLAGRKTLFLLDEPASNLHAGAQSQLLDSFPRIASRGTQIIYSTHSHYLINPDWLDQAFIVSNAAMIYNDVSEKPPMGTRQTSISAERYRSFVGNNPDKTTYFQPVLDRLQVVPSRLDAMKPSVLVEGKGDYLILAFGLLITGRSGAYAVIPTRGADHFDELVGILLGWGVNFALCCDDDAAGRKAVKDFVGNWGLPEGKVFTLAAVDAALTGKRIESLLEPEDIDLVKANFGLHVNPTKSQIQLYFSEKLAVAEQVKLSSRFLSRIEALDDKVRGALGLLPPAQAGGSGRASTKTS